MFSLWKRGNKMAQIQEKVKNGKIISFKIKVFLGRDDTGKQIFRCKTWKPPAGMTNSKSRKEAERVAVLWEIELTAPPVPELKPKREKKKQEPVADVKEPEPRIPSMTFGEFVEDVWLPLCVRDGSHRPATIAMYTNILKIILTQLDDIPINEITGIRISQYLRWLRRGECIGLQWQDIDFQNATLVG